MSDVSAADAAMTRGNTAFEHDDLGGAAACYEEAVRALVPADDPIAADLYENLGVVYWKLGRWRPAIRAFLRVLDGDLVAREQSLWLLVSCCFRDGLPIEGERLLAIYNARFGPHPEGWSREPTLKR